MKTHFRSEISSTLARMEQGRFQDFCLAFLPLYNPLYKNLARFGHTVEGKTRKGTPDLLKTTTEGFQIAVQCSTEENYWIPPRQKEKYSESWKPCQDIDKCLTALENPTEITLCSNNEITTNQPNAKTRIIEYAQARTEARILCLSIEDLDEVLAINIHNSDYELLFREFFPDVFQLIELNREAQKNRVAIEVLREGQPAHVNLVMNVLAEVLDQTADIEKVKDLTLSRIEEHEARYQEREIPLTALEDYLRARFER